MLVLSGQNATDVTQLECPWRGSPMAVPEFASHNRMVLSRPLETMRAPLEENATDRTQSEWAIQRLRPRLHPTIERCDARPRQCGRCQGKCNTDAPIRNSQRLSDGC